MEYDKNICPIVDVDGVIASGKQFDLDIILPQDNRNVIYGIVRDCHKEPIRDAVVKLIEVIRNGYDKEERKPVSHTFTDKEGEFVFGPLCPDKYYEIQIWVDRVKHAKICATCDHEGDCLKGVDIDCKKNHKPCKEHEDEHKPCHKHYKDYEKENKPCEKPCKEHEENYKPYDKKYEEHKDYDYKPCDKKCEEHKDNDYKPYDKKCEEHKDYDCKPCDKKYEECKNNDYKACDKRCEEHKDNDCKPCDKKCEEHKDYDYRPYPMRPFGYRR